MPPKHSNTRFLKGLWLPGWINKKYRRLIDYELLNDGGGKRTIGFGYHARGSRLLTPLNILQHWWILLGSSLVAGVLESLSAMAYSHLKKRHCINFPCMSHYSHTICYNANIIQSSSVHTSTSHSSFREEFTLSLIHRQFHYPWWNLRESWALS